MSTPSKAVISPEKQALLALRKMRAKLDELERARTEPIAIVGLGCRFPGGAVDAESFWRVLDGGVDTVSEIPRDRFDIDAYYDPDPEARGRIYTRRGAFVHDIDRFDAPFFGMLPREAVSLDPQQRLLLEVAWEALENAGQAPDALEGTKTGVFIGIGSGDYGQLQLQRRDAASLDLYFGTGSAPSAAAGRLSYLLGLVGPCIAVDTACSASLVAVHLACQSLRGGECRMALAGGVNLNILPEIFINLCLARMLAPDGRCKTFDAAADGYVRGEGCGLVVLKRLSDATVDGDRILALIRGTAVNQDGRSGGFTAPSELAQEELLRDAAARAGIAPVDVDYVEAHGTGTSLGDPIEMQALAAVFCEGRPADRPLAVGSVKTNIGHLEAAAGIAGLIKVVLALQHRSIPPHLHLKAMNPLLALNGAPVIVPTTRLAWPSEGRPRRAGVSSFGFAGTNAHAVLEEAPDVAPYRAAADRPLHILALSAKSETALDALAAKFERHLAGEPSVADACFTANAGRAHGPHRLAVVGASSEEMRAALSAWRAGEAAAAVFRSKGDRQRRPDIAFLFTGQGAQYAGMGRRLYETQPAFRSAMDRCDELLRPQLAEPLLSVMFPPSAESRLLDQTAYTQVALFALEYALAELWKSWGIEPAIVMGHSLGEYTAACVAGFFSLEDGLTLVAARGRLMQALPADGEMLAVFAGETDVRRMLAPDESFVSIGAVNGPANVVISGAQPAVRAVRARLELAGVRCERLSVSHAFHSALMEPILEDFRRVARDVTFTPARIGIVSNLTGELIDPSVIATPEYWCRHLRETVRFSAGMATAYQQGARIFLEIGPSPTLLAMGRRIIDDEAVAWLPSLRKGRDDWKQMLDTLGRLYAAHATIDWRRFDAGYVRRKIALPTYPFQRQRYWIEGVARPPSVSQEHPGPAGTPPREAEYEVAWQEADARTTPAPHGHAPAGPWIILADRGGVGAALADLLVSSGAQVRMTFAAPEGGPSAEEEIDPADEAAVQRVLNGFPASASTAPSIVFLWPLDVPPTPGEDLSRTDAIHRISCASLLRIIQTLARTGAPVTNLWMVTRGAQAVGRESGPVAVAQAPIWGMGRVVALEQPTLHPRLVDLEPAAASEEARRLFQEISRRDDEDQVAVRGSTRYVPRVVRTPPRRTRALRCAPDATYALTGGFGGLGLRVAQLLADRGARHLALIGRTGLPDRADWGRYRAGDPLGDTIAAVAELERRGIEVRPFRVDVGDPAGMAAVVDELRAGRHPLRGVVHAAGVSAVCDLSDLNAAAMTDAFRAKVAGGWILHQLTQDLSLDFFVLFSSIASVWGSKGQAAYAAANHFLDALAHHRVSLGLTALSVNWGPWAGGGMATAEARATLASVGVSSLTPDAALGTLERLMGGSSPQVTVAAMDWDVFKAVYTARGPRPLLDRIEPEEGPSRPSASGTEDMLRRLREAPPDERPAVVADFCARAVADVAGLDAVACDRPLAQLGLDSLMALEARNRIQRAFGVTVPVVSFLDGTDAHTLAAAVLQQLDAREGRSSAAEGGARPSIAPLSSAQTRIWFFEQLRPGTGTFNDQIVIRLCGALDVAALERAFTRIVRRHDALRTTIAAGEDGPVQRVAASLPRNLLEVIDVPAGPDGAEVEAQRLVDATLRERFDLERGPLFRARLLRLSSTDHLLVYAIHHIVNDGWSLRVLVSEVAALYTADVTGQPSPLPPLAVQYADLARRQQHALAADLYRDDVAYWRNCLANAPAVTELPTDYPRDDRVSPRGASQSRVLDDAVTTGLNALARTRGATPFMALLAAFKCLLSRLTGQTDLIVGTPMAARTAEAEPLIGCFINQLPLRTDVSGDPSFLDVLDRVRESALGAYAHQELPFEKLVEALQPARDPDHPPVFQILFNMLATPPSRIELPGVAGQVETTSDDRAKFDLAMHVVDRDGSLILHLVYNANLYTAATARMVVEEFEHVLRQASAAPAQRLSAFSLLTASEQDALVGAFNERLEGD